MSLPVERRAAGRSSCMATAGVVGDRMEEEEGEEGEDTTGEGDRTEIE